MVTMLKKLRQLFAVPEFLLPSLPGDERENVYVKREVGPILRARRWLTVMWWSNILVSLFFLFDIFGLGFGIFIRLALLLIPGNYFFVVLLDPLLHSRYAWARWQYLHRPEEIMDIAALPSEFQPSKEEIARQLLHRPAQKALIASYLISWLIAGIFFFVILVAEVFSNGFDAAWVLLIGIFFTTLFTSVILLCIAIFFRLFFYFLLFSSFASDAKIGWKLAEFTCLNFLSKSRPVAYRRYLTEWDVEVNQE